MQRRHVTALLLAALAGAAACSSGSPDGSKRAGASPEGVAGEISEALQPVHVVGGGDGETDPILRPIDPIIRPGGGGVIHVDPHLFCESGIIDHAIDPLSELMVVDPAVVGDARTHNDSGGAWSFRHLVEEMTPAGGNANAFATAWFNTWETVSSVNALPVETRSLSAIRSAWPTDAAGNFDLAKAPFQLLAIVNRLDLRANNCASAGEARFVFGFTAGSRRMTVIFEYATPTRAGLSAKNWARSWHALGCHPVGSDAYKTALQAITDAFTKRDAAPERLSTHGNAISQIRTNELVLAGPWEMREFHLTTEGIELATTKQTPHKSFSGSVALRDFLLANGSGFVTPAPAGPYGGGGIPEVPRVMLGGANPEDFTWTAPTVPEPVRHAFGAQTCNGCHNSDIGGQNIDGFYHVSPLEAAGASRLSKFLTAVEFPRRKADFASLLASTGGCFVPIHGPVALPPHAALRASPALRENVRLAELPPVNLTLPVH